MNNNDDEDEYFDSSEEEEDNNNISMEEEDNTQEVLNFLDALANKTCQMAEIAAGLLEESSNDDDDEPMWGGSRPGRSSNKKRDFVGAYNRLVSNYFSGLASKYNEEDFERQFRMPRSVFNRIQQAILGCPPFVQQTNQITQLPGIYPLV